MPGWYRYDGNQIIPTQPVLSGQCGSSSPIYLQGNAGADPGFQVRGAHLKKSRRAERGAKIFGVFRVKNHDFTQTKIIFFPILGGARAGCALPLDPPL